MVVVVAVQRLLLGRGQDRGYVDADVSDDIFDYVSLLSLSEYISVVSWNSKDRESKSV